MFQREVIIVKFKLGIVSEALIKDTGFDVFSISRKTMERHLSTILQK